MTQDILLIALRERTGLSQREIERRLGWKRGHVSMLESGQRRSPRRVEQLRAFYGLATPPEVDSAPAE